jgi:cyclin B
MSVINDPQYTAIYSGDIFEFLKNQETKFTPTDVYMTPLKQPDINGKMRAILIDWLVDVHLKFKLKDETLYVTVALIDRYLSLVHPTQNR